MDKVLVLGATSTIAGDVARLYAARGANLCLVGRDPDKLSQLQRELGAPVVHTQALDFTTSAEENARCVQRGIEALGGLDVCLIAHGLLGDQLRSEAEFAEAQRIIDTNFTSVVSLLIPLANHFDAQGTGHLAVISSVAGERGRPRNYTYGAAKGALTTYLQGVRSRLWPRVAVHTIKLGPVVTPMTVDHPKNALFAESPAVAHEIVAAIERGDAEPFVPWFWRPIMATVEHLPESIFQRFGFLSGR